MFGRNVAERQPHTFEDYAICMMKTIQEYFGDYSNIDIRMNNYPDTDYIEDGIPIGKVSDLIVRMVKPSVSISSVIV